MGFARAPVTRPDTSAVSAVERPPDGGQRSAVADSNGFALAGPAGGIRVLEDDLQQASALVGGRDLGGCVA